MSSFKTPPPNFILTFNFIALKYSNSLFPHPPDFNISFKSNALKTTMLHIVVPPSSEKLKGLVQYKNLKLYGFILFHDFFLLVNETYVILLNIQRMNVTWYSF